MIEEQMPEIQISDLNETERIEYYKKYRRDYYRKKYNLDIEYKEYKQKYNKKLYVKKSIKCAECFRQVKLADLQSMNFAIVDPLICVDCKIH